MANHASAVKAARQSLKHRDHNLAVRSRFKTAVKKLRTAVTAKYDSKDVAKKSLEPLLNEVQQLLMKAASKKIIKKETASRQVSRLSTAVHKALV